MNLNNATSILLVLVALFFASALAYPVKATEAYAEKTGLDCEACHLDPVDLRTSQSSLR